MATISDLGRQVKAKYPGTYDDVGDSDLGARVKAKYPGAYDDFTDEAPKGPKTGRESVIGEEAPGFMRGVARAGWAIPGLVGLDYETAAGVESAIKDPSNLEKNQGLGFMDRVRWYRDAERERSRRGEAENPVKTGLGLGVGSVPETLLLPQAKAAEGAGLASRALAAAKTAGAQSAAIEAGVSGALPVGERLKRAGAAAASGAALGALAPVPSHVPAQEAIDSAAGEQVPSPVADWLRSKGGERNIKASGAIQSDIARARKQIGRDRLTDLGADFSEYGLTGPTTTPFKTYDRAIALQGEAGKEMGGILKSADAVPEAATTIGDLVKRVKTEVLDPLQRNPHTSSAPQGMAGGGSAADQMTGLLEKYRAIYGNQPLTPSVLHEIRKNISDDLYGLRGTKDPWASAYKDALHDFRGIVSDELNQSVDRAGMSTEAWQAANRKYEVGARAEEFADKGMDRAHGNNMVSPLEFLAGLGGAGMGFSHGGAGLTLGGLAAAGGTALVRRHGSGALGSTLVKLSNALKTNPEVFGDAAPKLLAAAERGPEALAAAHYVLSLDPGSGYRARAAQVLDTPDDRLAQEHSP